MRTSLYAKFENVLRVIVGDAISRALAIIDIFHHEIHEGRTFSISGEVTLPAGGVYEFLIITPDTTRWIHMNDFVAESDASLNVKMFYDSTKTDVPGNRVTPVNRNLNSPNVSVATICHTPGGSGDGTQAWSRTAIADHPLQGEASESSRKEWVLKQNSTHLMKLTGAENDIVDYQFDWYEHQPD